MRYEDMHPAMRKALGFHEALRRLGFVPDHIRLYLSEGVLYSAVFSGGRYVLMAAGEFQGSEQDVADTWGRVAEAVRDSSLPDEDMYRCLHEAVPEGRELDFAASLSRAGARIPGKRAN